MSNWKEKIGKDGRHTVYSFRTGKTYMIEPIKPNAKYKGEGWGDQDPVSGKLTGDYGVKYEGAITADDSIITEENGFTNIEVIEKGSPYWRIEQLDSQYPTLDKNDKN